MKGSITNLEYIVTGAFVKVGKPLLRQTSTDVIVKNMRRGIKSLMNQISICGHANNWIIYLEIIIPTDCCLHKSGILALSSGNSFQIAFTTHVQITGLSCSRWGLASDCSVRCELVQEHYLIHQYRSKQS